ncbi:MAG: NAD(P)/FAD-dependent oxidoreductase [Planctomycetota bacterium]
MSDPIRCDVAVLGGGLAGLALARLLQLEQPQAEVVVLERDVEHRRKVGESTVEIGAHFLHQRLDLGEELARTQLPKNGLRFWFDDGQGGLPFAEASEDGPATYAFFRAYQLERETLEATLLARTRDWATHLRGVRGVKVERGGAGQPHRVRFEHAGASHALEARWVVDATGFRGLLGREDNLEPEPRLVHSSTWGWFKGAKKVDELIEGEAARRMIFSERFLSTNHLLNEGYWTWVIPLASGLLSVGVGWDETACEGMPETPAQLQEFFQKHRQTRDLLQGAEMVDYGAMKKMARRPKRFVSGEERIGWVGTAAGFVDPFFSNGIDMIGLGCEAVTDAIGRDLRGELCLERIAKHNEIVLLYFEHYVLSVAGLYRTFASQELSVLRYRREVHVYWALYTWAYLSGRLFDPEFLADYAPALRACLERDRLFSKQMRAVYRALKARGDLRRGNRGRYSFNQLGWRFVPYVRFEQHVGGPLDLARSLEATREIDTGCTLALLDVLYDGDRSPQSDLMFQALHAVWPELLARSTAQEELDEAFFAQALELMDAPLRRLLGAEGVTLPEGPALRPESWRRPFHGLTDGLAGEAALTVRRLFNKKPELTDFSDLPRAREKVQTQHRWSVEHTPWLKEVPTFRSVYDLLGERWWQDTEQPFAVLARLQEELRLAGKLPPPARSQPAAS